MPSELFQRDDQGRWSAAVPSGYVGPQYTPDIPTDHWTTREGQVIPIASMEDTHLMNAIFMIRTTAENTAIENAGLHGLTMNGKPIGLKYRELMAEATKRGLPV